MKQHLFCSENNKGLSKNVFFLVFIKSFFSFLIDGPLLQRLSTKFHPPKEQNIPIRSVGGGQAGPPGGGEGETDSDVKIQERGD